ncbi:MAG: hypothetical protein ACI9TI_002304, partial [Natronomonas sp.]
HEGYDESVLATDEAVGADPKWEESDD